MYKNGTCLKNSMLLVKAEHEEGDTSESLDWWVLCLQFLVAHLSKIVHADSVWGMTDIKIHSALVGQSVKSKLADCDTIPCFTCGLLTFRVLPRLAPLLLVLKEPPSVHAVILLPNLHIPGNIVP